MTKSFSRESVRLPRNVYEFFDQVLIECPRCAKQAQIRAPHAWSKESVLTCLSCGYSATPTGGLGLHWITAFREGRDFRFGTPFWLRERVGNEVVWAANWHHFEDLLFFFEGDWRRDRHGHMGSNYNPNWSYRTRYPKWMQQKSNRPAILKALARIKKRRWGRLTS